MAAVSTELPGASVMMSQQSLMAVKQELIDPSYHQQSMLSQPPNIPLIEKVKRSYTRKIKKEPGEKAPKAKKVKKEPTELSENGLPIHQQKITEHMPVQKKKRDRFKGTTEAEVLTRVLPDHVKENLDILIVGINPGLTAAYVQHHYAGPGNHFWKCLYLSGMTPEPMNAMQDAELLNYGIGFTNIVARTTRGSADLTRKEIAEGGVILREKVIKYKPKIALFNGKGIYEVFCGHKNFNFGLQPEPFPGCPDTRLFVNPSSSARCTQLPRAVDKVPFFEALKRVRDYFREYGSVDGINMSEVTFPDFKLVTAPPKAKREVVKDEPIEPVDPLSQATRTDLAEAPPPPQSKEKPKRRRMTKQKIADSKQTVQTSNHLHQIDVIDVAGPPLQPNSHIPSSSMYAQPTNTLVKHEIIGPLQHDHHLTAALQHPILSTPTQAAYHTFGMMNQQLANNAHQTHEAPVKQERPDIGQYGIMPSSTAANFMSVYPPYSGYWNYMQCSTNGMLPTSYMSLPSSVQLPVNNTNGYMSLAPSQNSVPTLQVAPGSPAMSNQSSLTQASLDSLPKADSASNVANWLQTIPNVSQ